MLEEFARLMLTPSKLNGQKLFLFKHLFQLYKTGQLLIPSIVIDTVVVLQEKLCEYCNEYERVIKVVPEDSDPDDEKYNVRPQQINDSQQIDNFINKYHDSKLSIYFFFSPSYFLF
jgi:hypothetical protein